jgi:hypothetical protein
MARTKSNTPKITRSNSSATPNPNPITDPVKEHAEIAAPARAPEAMSGTTAAEVAAAATVPTVRTAPEVKTVPEPRKFEVLKSEPRKNVLPINLDEEIRCRAYELYQQRGNTPGSESDDWLRAEREVRQRYQQQSA